MRGRRWRSRRRRRRREKYFQRNNKSEKGSRKQEKIRCGANNTAALSDTVPFSISRTS
jgi:hypothetical protein